MFSLQIGSDRLELHKPVYRRLHLGLIAFGTALVAVQESLPGFYHSFSFTVLGSQTPLRPAFDLLSLREALSSKGGLKYSRFAVQASHLDLLRPWAAVLGCLEGSVTSATPTYYYALTSGHGLQPGRILKECLHCYSLLHVHALKTCLLCCGCCQ